MVSKISVTVHFCGCLCLIYKITLLCLQCHVDLRILQKFQVNELHMAINQHVSF